MSPEIVVGKPEALAEVFARRCEAAAELALAARGRFALAVPGGSVAETFFPRLASAGVDWSRVDLFWTDERAVAADDPASNFGLARRLWLDPAAVPEAGIHPMPAAAPDLEAAAAVYAAELARVAGSPPRLDLALLGVGEDGHVASLFPESPSLTANGRSVVAVSKAPKPPARRLSLGLAVLAAARLVVVAAFGAAKSGAVGAAVGDTGSVLPLALLLRRAPRPLLLLDPDAAALLPAHPAAFGRAPSS